jgi:L-alanine-DL-glutamate epimerase-like enolase superfamily enzyme
MAAMHGASVVPHCWKTGINAAAARHLQAATPNVPFIEMLTPQLFPSPLRADLVAPEPQLIDGRLALPEAPGLGVELDRRTVQRYAV